MAKVEKASCSLQQGRTIQTESTQVDSVWMVLPCIARQFMPPGWSRANPCSASRGAVPGLYTLGARRSP